MRNILSTIALSLSALITTSAMAAQQHDSRFNHQPPAHWSSNDKYPSKQHWNNDNRYNSHRVNPSRDWRVGQPLPRQYDSSRYKVDYRESKHLKKPKKNEAWYKVNGDYVLVNTKSDKIIRII